MQNKNGAYNQGLTARFQTYSNDQLLVLVVDIVSTDVGELDSVLGSNIESGVEILNRLGLDELLARLGLVALD